MGASLDPDGGQLDVDVTSVGGGAAERGDVLEVDLAHGRALVGALEGQTQDGVVPAQRQATQVEVGVAAHAAPLVRAAGEGALRAVPEAVESAHLVGQRLVKGRVGERDADGDDGQKAGAGTAGKTWFSCGP